MAVINTADMEVVNYLYNGYELYSNIKKQTNKQTNNNDLLEIDGGTK